MSTHNELAVCPICGAHTFHTVISNGHYDAANLPHETNPNECQTCALLKRTNPGMYDLLAKLWSKLLDERAKAKAHNAKRESETLDEFDLYYLFRDSPEVWTRLAKRLRRGIAWHKRIAAKGHDEDGRDSWVWEKSVEQFVHRLLEDIKKAAVKLATK